MATKAELMVLSKDKLAERLAGRKNGKKPSVYNPFTKGGVRVGTGAIVGGVVGAFFDKGRGAMSPADHLWNKNVGAAAQGFSNRLKGEGSLPWGMIAVGGLAAVTVAKALRIKKIGPLLAS